MKIAIDGRTIVRNRTGVGVYADRLVRSLLAIDTKNEYTLFLYEDDPSLSAPHLKKVHIGRYHKIGLNRFWENVVLPRYLKSSQIDIYFSPAYILPITRSFRLRRDSPRRTRYVVTIHDLVAYRHPETFTLKIRLWQKIFVSNAVRVADRILADSQATMQDLRGTFTMPHERIRVVHLPVDEQFHPIEDQKVLERIHRTYALPEKFILYVGTLEPRKNLVRLARAYALLPLAIRKEYGLVLAGGAGWYSKSIIEQIEGLRLGGQIRLIGYIEQQDLPVLYNLATLFAYVSLYEGFGAPPLEAMACGIPVICSNVSSLPEVVGDAGVLVDPGDEKNLARQMESLLVDESLRCQMSAQGLKRAKEFDGTQKARQVLEIFEELASETGT